jgi:hypothetical protein
MRGLFAAVLAEKNSGAETRGESQSVLGLGVAGVAGRFHDQKYRQAEVERDRTNSSEMVPYVVESMMNPVGRFGQFSNSLRTMGLILRE